MQLETIKNAMMISDPHGKFYRVNFVDHSSGDSATIFVEDDDFGEYFFDLIDLKGWKAYKLTEIKE